MYRLTKDPNVVECLTTGAWVSFGTWRWGEYQQWVAAGGVAEPIAKTRSLEELKIDLVAAATATRWDHETGGIELAGVRVGTTLEDQNRLSGVLAAIQIGGLESVDFKAQNGWVELTAIQLQEIGQAISAHVQACFSAERGHHEAIALIASVEAAEAYDVSQGWPETTS